MTPELRRVVAFIAARLQNPVQSVGVFDLATQTFYPFGGRVSKAEVIVYDTLRQCVIQGVLGDLYDGGTQQSFALQLQDGALTGTDHASGTDFELTVDGTEIELHDHALDEIFRFTLSA